MEFVPSAEHATPLPVTLYEPVFVVPQCRMVYFCCWRAAFIMWDDEVLLVFLLLQ
jgi:hypothetical protein